MKRRSNLAPTASLSTEKETQDTLNSQIMKCSACPRLLTHCKAIATQKKKMYENWDYWGQPVPNFGNWDARLIIVGLAPAAHGANRTGRMFTGDQSGVWLYRALHRAGFANQPRSESLSDGLQLQDTLITAVCHCAPPENKPTPQEIQSCSHFLRDTLNAANKKRVILALGSIAWQAVWKILDAQAEIKGQKIKFAHGIKVPLKSGGWLIGSYHPSQQNTFTGRLTESAFDDVFKSCREFLSE